MPFQSLVLLAALALPLAAQSYNGSAYGFFTAGACQHGYALYGGGGGVEGFLWKGLTAGVDVSQQRFADDRRTLGMTLFSVPVGYHFVDRNKPLKWDPFVSAGVIGVAAWQGSFGYHSNIGGGVTYWFKDRLGVRTEFRAHVIGYDEVTSQFRIGIAWRFR